MVKKLEKQNGKKGGESLKSSKGENPKKVKSIIPKRAVFSKEPKKTRKNKNKKSPKFLYASFQNEGLSETQANSVNKVSSKNKKIENESNSIFTEESKMIFSLYLKHWVRYLSGQAKNKFYELLEGESKIENTEEKEKKLGENYPLNYQNDHRFGALIALKQFIESMGSTIRKIPFGFIFSVVALGDFFLEKTEKDIIDLVEMKKIFISAMNILAKEIHIDFLNSNDFLQVLADKNSLIEIEREIINTINGIIYPVKYYDFFQKIFLHFIHLLIPSRLKEEEDEIKSFLFLFRLEFYEVCFLFLLGKPLEKRKQKPSIDFFHCLKLSYEKSKYLLISRKKDAMIIEEELESIMKKIDYPKEKYKDFLEEIKETKKKVDIFINNYLKNRK